MVWGTFHSNRQPRLNASLLLTPSPSHRLTLRCYTPSNAGLRKPALLRRFYL